MIYCKKCGSEMPEGTRFCMNCGSEIVEQVVPAYQPPQPEQPPYQQPAQPQYQPYGTQPQPDATYQPYGAQQPQPEVTYQPYGAQQPPYAPQQANTQGFYQQPVEQAEAYNLAAKAKSNGIVAIVFAFFIPLVSWICGGMGLSKANKALDYGNMTGDQQLIDDAKKAKTLATIGLIISIAMAVFSAFSIMSQQ